MVDEFGVGCSVKFNLFQNSPKSIALHSCDFSKISFSEGKFQSQYRKQDLSKQVLLEFRWKFFCE